MWQKSGCKIAQKTKKKVKNRTIDKNIGGKSAIEHKKVNPTRNGAKDGVQNR